MHLDAFGGAGDGDLTEQTAKAELGHINRELRRLRTQMAALEARKSA